MSVLILLLTIFLALLLFLFVFHHRVVIVLYHAATLMFFGALALAATTLFLPQLYDSLADGAFKQAGSYSAIQSIDSSLDKIAKAPQNLVDDLRQRLGLAGGEPQLDQTGPGVVETAVYPSMLGILAITLRVSSFIISSLVMVSVLYFRYSTSAAVDLEHLRKRVAVLEAQNKVVEDTKPSGN